MSARTQWRWESRTGRGMERGKGGRCGVSPDGSFREAGNVISTQHTESQGKDPGTWPKV